MMDEGFSSLPVVLLLSVLLACGAIAIGASGLKIVRRNLEKQELLKDFYKTYESIYEISAGGEKMIQIRSNGKIILHDRLIEAWLDGEIIRTGMLPITAPSVELVYGDYILFVNENLELRVRKWKP